MTDEPLDFFPRAATPRPEQRRLLRALGDALAEAEADPTAPRVFLVEAPPGVGKSHVALALARWSGDAYLLTSQKLLQDQYEREFGGEVQLVKGRDNYLCERYPGARVPTSQGACRRPRGPLCQCPYARAKAAALAGPVFCANTFYFATLRQWHAEQLRRRRLLVVDEAHALEAQMVSVLAVAFARETMIQWFRAPLPRLADAEAYRPVLADHLARLETDLQEVTRALEGLRPSGGDDDAFTLAPPDADEQALLRRRDELESLVGRLRFFVGAAEREWVVRYPDGGALELVPLEVRAEIREFLTECAELAVLSSASLGPREAAVEPLGLQPDEARAFTSPSPFALEQRPIVYRPVGALSRASLAALEPALFGAVATILAGHAADKGLIHAPSYAAADRLVRDLAARSPALARRLILVPSSGAKPDALERHRGTPAPTVLVSPSLREGVDLPDALLAFQIVTKLPFPDLGDPWTAARQARDPRGYALETARALVQAYGRACRHAGDFGVTYVLDGQFARFVRMHRPLLPEWFLEAADAALRRQAEGDA